MKKIKKLIAAIIVLALTLTTGACSDVYTVNETRQDVYSYDEAFDELKVLAESVGAEQVENPVLDIYSEESSAADALADISTFPVTVQGRGQINLEIAAATELSADSPDDWLNIVAQNFNSEKYEIDGKTVSVSVRRITSGEALTYVLYGNYQPEVYIPSMEAWGDMLEASGIGISKLADRIAGNTAGILVKPDVHDTFIEQYEDSSMANVIQASLDGNLVFATTNPYTSSTGFNALCETLHSFDPGNPLSAQATEKLLQYQEQMPPVAYTTAVLQKSAAKGIINAMVMEEQAYVNTPELRDYVYIPFGMRHDHPVYTFSWDSEIEVQAAVLFVEYCQNEQSQKLATNKGFNRHDDYVSSDWGMSGADYLTAQKLWKDTKNGGKPILAVFVADVSGSMRGEPLRSLQKSLVSASSFIGSDNYIGLVSYASNVVVNLPIGKFDASQRAYFSGEVKNLSAAGGTATYNAVLTGLQMLLEKSEEVPDARMILFVLTDGDQNEGYSLKKILPVVGGLQIPVYSIAYNYGGTSDLERLSEINEATVIKADSDDIVNQLRNLFNVEM